MSEHEDPDWPGDTDPDDGPRTEGVRIIGAQEAAEAAARPDVARRRRRGEKGFGDRPDAAEAAYDLPKITISTTEADPTAASDPEPGDDPRVGDQGIVARPDPGSEWSMGHARVVSGPDPEDLDPVDTEEPSETRGDTPLTPPPFVGGADMETDHTAPRPDPRPWVDPEPEPDLEPDPEPEPAGGTSDFGDDESFVLPHWTEPATGQIPRVVTGDEQDVSELTDTGSQPRWRDEGERTSDTGFADLLDDSPRLGALGGDEIGGPDDDFFDSEVDRDPLEAFAPEASTTDRPRRRPAARKRPSRPPSAPLDYEDGEARRPSGGDGGGAGADRNLVMAVGVGVILVGIGLICFSLGGLATTLLAAVIIGAGSYEYFTTVTQAGYAPAGLVGLVAVIGLVLATYFGGLAGYPIALPIVVIAGLVWYVWVAPSEGSVQSLGVTLLGVMWIGFLGSFATLFLGLGKVIEDSNPAITSNPGIGVLIAAVIVTVSHDVGAYFSGRFLGKTPMSSMSPNKTLEGLAGGVLTALIVTVIAVGIVGIAPIGPDKPRTFVFALLCALAAPLGDLCESFVKRDLGVKDMGTLLPGHGGVLDRFDSLLFVLPTAYFVTVLFDLWSGIGA